MKTNTAALLILLTALSMPLLADCDFDDFPIMEEMKLYPLLADSTFNNRPMMVKGYTVDQGLDDIVDFYHSRWKQANNSSYGSWYQVSTLTHECLMTVQIARNGKQSSQGRLVISNVPTIDPEAALGEGVMAPSDAVVVSDLSTRDGPKKGRVTVLASASSPSELMQFYRGNMTMAGWVLEHSFSQDKARVLVFKDGLKTSNILLVPAGDMTQVLINEETIN